MNEEHILDELLSQSGGSLIINFWEKCTGASCTMEAIMDELESMLESQGIDMLILRLNLDDNRNWARKYKVQGTPSMVIVHDHKVVTAIRGKVTIDEIVRELTVLGIMRGE